jgi:hypothetical protein
MANLSSVITQTVGNSSGGVNLITSPSASSIWTATGLTLSTTTTAAELPLEGFSSSAVKFLLTGSTTSAYVDFLVPTALAQTKLGLQWYARANVTTIGSITLSLSSYASAGNRTSNTSPTTVTLQTSSVASAATSFNTTFDTANQQYYRLTLNFPASASNWYTLAQFVLGPGVITQGAAISEWQSWTPMVYGSGSNPTKGTNTEQAYWRRVGSEMEIHYMYKQTAAGSAGSGTYTWSLPAGYTIDTNIVSITNGSNLGSAYIYNGTSEYTGFVSTNNISRFLIYIYPTITTTGVAASTSTSFGNTTLNVWVAFRVPIAEWAGNGTVNLGAGAQVEYAYNSSATTTTDTASFAYGPTGVLFNAMAPTTTVSVEKRVRFQYPIQADDIIQLECYNGVNWAPFADVLGGYFNNDANTLSQGAVVRPVSGTTTDVSILFFSSSNAGTWSGLGALGYKWRVRKAKASSPVGFSKASYASGFGLMAPAKGQYSMTVTHSQAGWATLRAVGIYYQDQDGNHRLKFNISGTFTSATVTAQTFTLSGVTFKNVANVYQACTGLIYASSPGAFLQCITNPNASTITLLTASTASATGASVAGDVELESAPTWA